MSRAEASGKSFENLMAFITDERVTSSPIETKAQTPSLIGNQTQAEWERNWHIAGQYLGTDKILEEIGRDHDITGERVRQIVKSGVEKLHQIQGPEVKNEFSVGQFDYGKPPSLTTRRTISKGHGGNAVKIEQLLVQGRTLQQIKRELALSNLARERGRLHQWGIEIPYENRPILPRYLKLRDPKLPDEEKQKLLDSVEHHGVLQVLSSGEEPIIMFVSRIGRQAGLFLKNDKVNFLYALLRSKGVPASSFSKFTRIHEKDKEKSITTYYFICTSDRGRAIEIIKGAEKLDPFRINPVTVFGKATNRIPRVVELMNSGNYSHLGSLIIEIRGKSLGRIKAENVIFDDCSVSVFRYRTATFYRLDQKEQLKEYLRDRLKELGLI